MCQKIAINSIHDQTSFIAGYMLKQSTKLSSALFVNFYSSSEQEIYLFVSPTLRQKPRLHNL